MATGRYTPNDMRRQVGSPRPKTRENKDTLCRNVLIYGHCRYQDQGCTFNHDQTKTPSSQADSAARKLNVESPSFTPATVPQQPAKKTTFSTQAASAAPFTPRAAGASTPSLQPNAEAPAFNPANSREFTPQSYEFSPQPTANGTSQDNGLGYDAYSAAAVGPALSGAAQYNPYAADPSSMANAPGAAYYQGQGGYSASLPPPQYHLYAPVGPYREDLLPYQRATYDFFMPEKVRDELQRKAFATRQVMPNMPLPNLDHYHSLVSLDTHPRRNTGIFGYQSWVYKATSSKNGKVYCLRRLEGYRLTNELAIQPSRTWRRIINANIVTLHEAFTTRTFGDSSLIFAYDYHPCSQTLVECHFPANQGGRFRPASAIPENVLWSYICQIANAIKAVHSANLAVRCIEITKIIVTDKNRIRLAAPSVLDVVQYDTKKPVPELQQDDFLQFGKVILALATSNLSVHMNNVGPALDSIAVKYSSELRDAVRWLVTPAQPGAAGGGKSADELVALLSGRMLTAFNLALHTGDSMQAELYRELENGRLVRLLCKLGAVNERGEYDNDPLWAEHGERYQLKLLRDYVFHQVDADGHPHVDLGHMLLALNKLDAGSDERIRLVSRDEQTVFVVSYRELKQQVASAFNDLMKHHGGGGGGGGGSSSKQSSGI